MTATYRTNAALRAANLSYYTLCRLADALACVNPMLALEHRLARDVSMLGELTTDALGNFVSWR